VRKLALQCNNIFGAKTAVEGFETEKGEMIRHRGIELHHEPV
jgi:hypothetical protein